MKPKKTKKIVFVCTGNTCRSPIAEYLCRKQIERLQLKNVKVCSVGIKAVSGTPINEKSALLLAEQGIDTTEFTSTKLTNRLLKDAFALVCMTESQRDLLMEMRWKALRAAGEDEIENNVYSFAELVGYQIIDPYGKDLDCYRYVFELISGGMTTLIDKLLPPEIRETRQRKPRKVKTDGETEAPSAPKKRGRPRKNREN